jgi:hypothetical protein
MHTPDKAPGGHSQQLPTAALWDGHQHVVVTLDDGCGATGAGGSVGHGQGHCYHHWLHQGCKHLEGTQEKQGAK